jgi:hypothetical protein
VDKLNQIASCTDLTVFECTSDSQCVCKSKSATVCWVSVSERVRIMFIVHEVQVFLMPLELS